MVPLPAGLRVRRVPYRDAPPSDLTALHLVTTEVERERRPDQPPQPLDRYVAFARSFPSSITEWTWVVETEQGVPVAMATCWHRDGDHRQVLHADVLVRPQWRRQRVATHLLARICEVAEAEGRSRLIGMSTDGARAGEAFAQRLGARVGRVNRTSELGLADVDPSLLSGWVEAGPRRAPSYALQPVDGVYPTDLYDDVIAFHDIMQTAPQDDLEMATSMVTPEQIAEWDRTLLETGRHRWTIFVRDPAGACVGGSEVVFVPWDPATVFQGDTGIDPDHRGQGLGKWVKGGHAAAGVGRAAAGSVCPDWERLLERADAGDQRCIGLQGHPDAHGVAGGGVDDPTIGPLGTHQFVG